MKNKFLLCGFTGWCMEIIWTGICAIINRDYTITCHTSLWMFPIYGMAAVIGPVGNHLRKFPFYFRGIFYAAGIFTAEYITGSILRIFNACPWDYSRAKLNYKGLIRLDFAPLWFAAGLVFEKISKI